MSVSKQCAVLFVALLISACPVCADSDNQALLNSIELDYEKFTLDNGLRVLVHTDHKAPVVHVAVWYHVGSKDEPAGRSGFAHLFEHLMFNGSENFNDDFFKAFDGVGTQGISGNTTVDRTLYYETVPTNALERALWLESDRMGSLLGVITEEKLEEQRAVVKNEKRQGENSPTGDMTTIQHEAIFPVGHPYRHTTIGSMDDLDAGTVDDAKDWFTRYYGASNALLVISGDVDVDRAKELVEKMFSYVEPGPALTRTTAMVPQLANDVFEVREAEIATPEILRIWPVPGSADKDTQLLQLASAYLSGGKDSPLYKRIVATGLANNLRMYVMPYEIAGMLKINVELNRLEDAAKVMAIVDEEIARLVRNGPAKTDLQNIKTKNLINALRGMESVAAKASILASGELYADDPMDFKTKLQFGLDATAEDVAKAAAKWLQRSYYQLIIQPKSKTLTAVPDLADRTVLPDIGLAAELKLPEFQEAMLDNGIRVVLAERHNIPFIQTSILFDAGTSAEGELPDGVAKFAADLMLEGTSSQSAIEIQNALNNIGSTLRISSEQDWITASSNMLKTEIHDTLTIISDVVRNPAYLEKEIELKRGRAMNQIKASASRPNSASIMALVTEIYGKDHPYASPNLGVGSEQSVAVITRADIQAFHRDWINPDSAAIFVVGDTSLDEMLPTLNKTIGSWQSSASQKPVKTVPEIAAHKRSKVILVDSPGMAQASILAGHVAPTFTDEGRFEFDAANRILGVGFTSRLNMNLREDKGWSYGASSRVSPMRAERPWIISASVQVDKTKESIIEIVNELNALRGSNPITKDELDNLVEARTGNLPGRFETMGSVMSTMVQNFKIDLPLDDVLTYEKRYKDLTLEGIQTVVRDKMKPDQLIWIVVGDLSKIESDIRALNLGEVEVRQFDH